MTFKKSRSHVTGPTRYAVVGSHVTEPTEDAVVGVEEVLTRIVEKRSTADYVIHLLKSSTYELDHCHRPDKKICKVDHLNFKFKNFCLR